MSNANDNTAPRPKRLRSKSSNDISLGDDWLKVVLNDVEVDPSIETWNYFFQESHASRHKSQNSEFTFTTPFIFKSVNPAQQLTNGIESNNQRGQESYSSKLSSFSTNFLSEDLVGKVVEVLGILLEEVKSDIWRTITNVNKGKNK
jgi:hypothetical protein